MRVLELGDEPRLDLEATHEVRLIGQIRPNHLDRHFATDRDLARPVHDPEVTGAQALAYLISGNRQPEAGRGSCPTTDPERRKRVLTELVDRRPTDALEVVLAEGLRTCSGGACDAIGENHLPAVPDVEQSHDPVHTGTEVVAGSLLGRSQFDRHPHPDRAGRRPSLRGEIMLDSFRRRDGGVHRRERRQHPVAGVFEDRTAGRFDLCRQDLVVRSDICAHADTVGLPQRRAVLDVGHEEDDVGRHRLGALRLFAGPLTRSIVLLAHGLSQSALNGIG